MSRIDNRNPDQLRPLRLTPRYLDFAEGSALIEIGATRVLCAASIEETVPAFLLGRGRGWVTAEYAMLPRATHTRSARESTKGKIGGRTHEIQRLIGRSLRAVCDMRLLGERTIALDCDVLQADGGTRTASITGAWVALAEAQRCLLERGSIDQPFLLQGVAAVSAGLVGGVAMLDLAYEEDSRADVDANFVMTDDDRFVEVQMTAEGHPFSPDALRQLMALAATGIRRLRDAQREALEP